MPKNKGIYKIFKTKEEYEYTMTCMRTIMQQQTLDCMTLVLNEDFGFGPKMFSKLNDCFTKKWNEMCELNNEDVKCDRDLVYSEAKIDEALLRAVGKENFKPHSERYRL